MVQVYDMTIYRPSVIKALVDYKMREEGWTQDAATEFAQKRALQLDKHPHKTTIGLEALVAFLANPKNFPDKFNPA